MYMVTIYALCTIVIAALALSFVGIVPFAPFALIGSFIVLLVSTYSSSILCAWTFGTQHNRTSSVITALILFLTLAPGDSLLDFVKLVLVAGIATLSKYLLVWRGRHIFNPAAVALTAGTLLGLSSALWWVATPALLPVVVASGLVIVAKTRRYGMVTVFIGVALITSACTALITKYPVLDALQLDVTSGPLVFFAAIMLTEPLTSPGTKRQQWLYAVVVGVLYSAQIPWLSVPNITLLAGNLLTAMLVRRSATRLRVVRVSEIAPRTYELLAKPLHTLRYTPGQYMELQVPHTHPDSRGIRRVFSIASSPDELTVRLITKLPPASPSSFKRAFVQLQPGSVLRATYIGGDFTLPREPNTRLLFIAAGVGITPFRSMLAHMLATRDRRHVTIIYTATHTDALLYRTLLKRAEHELNTKTYFVTDTSLDDDFFARYHIDPSGTHAYLSGPPQMVDSLRATLAKTPNRPVRIVTDYFTGY